MSTCQATREPWPWVEPALVFDCGREKGHPPPHAYFDEGAERILVEWGWEEWN